MKSLAQKTLSSPSDAPWWASQWEPPHRFDGISRTASYVLAKDGTRIATYRYMPANLGPDDRIPAILVITPYISEVELTWLGSLVAPKTAELQLAEKFARSGYATIYTDGRGAGASFGAKSTVMMADMINDSHDVVDWIVEQSWSNGKVGATGVSAVGLAANWLAIGKHPAVKAIAPRFTTFDIFYDVHPGGLLMNRFLHDIDRKVRLLDSNRLWEIPETRLGRALAWCMTRGIRAVDEDTDQSLLKAAVSEHDGNGSFATAIATTEFYDDVLPGTDNETPGSQSPWAHLDDIASSGVAIYLFAGWLDGSFSRAMLNHFQNLKNPAKRIVIGPWNHGGRQYSSPFAPGKGQSDFDQAAEMVRFFDHYIGGKINGIEKEAPIHYFTMGEEIWKSTTRWPLTEARPLRLYFNSAGSLTANRPLSKGCDVHKVNFRATTGPHSRYGKHLTGPAQRAAYPYRRDRDRLLLTYDSPALSHAVEITGHPILTLRVSSDSEDGSFLVYLEDVAPDGEVKNITDGVLRGAFRKVSSSPPPYISPPPHRSLKRSDAGPIIPGEVMELIIDLFPVSYLLAKGHRLRVALSGADHDNFPLLPADRPPLWNVYWGPEGSSIELPVVGSGPSPNASPFTD